MTMLKDKVAFITGGASGIGEGTARRFAQEGALVAIADVDSKAGERICKEIDPQGKKAIFVECDVSDPASVKRAIQTTVDSLGKLDIVFANAGINGVWALSRN